MASNFYENLDLRYPEIAICLEDCEGKGKFFIPILTPILESNEAYDTKENGLNTQNILSDKTNLEIDDCTVSNYIELDIPNNGIAIKDQKFIIVFVGGDINKPRIIGGY